MLDYAPPSSIVSNQWLESHLNDSNLRIIAMDLDPYAYSKEHIPGSIFWLAFALLLPNLRTNFDLKAAEKLLSDCGINNDSTVVTVHRDYTATSGWIFWLLKTFGHRDERVLNGGFPIWKLAGLPTTNKPTEILPSNYQIQKIDHSLKITSDEVKKLVEQPNAILLDVRTPQEYRGEIYLQQPPKENKRAGHIPDAVNLFYELAHNKDGAFKIAKELKELYSNLSITRDKTVIPYCAVGRRSAHTWFILKYLSSLTIKISSVQFGVYPFSKWRLSLLILTLSPTLNFGFCFDVSSPPYKLKETRPSFFFNLALTGLIPILVCFLLLYLSMILGKHQCTYLYY